MYHIELRQFPHNFARFNLGDADLEQLVGDWVQDRIVEAGDRKWNPAQARLTILEGPELPVAELSMGRGWTSAQRRGVDVTPRVLEDAKGRLQRAPTQPAAGASAGGTPTAAASMSPGGGALSDPLALGVQMAALLGPDATRLLEAWRAAAADTPGLAPSQTLARAETNLASQRPGA